MKQRRRVKGRSHERADVAEHHALDADGDVPHISGHRQVTDTHLLTLARRRGMRLVTFDAAVHVLAGGHDVELLTML